MLPWIAAAALLALLGLFIVLLFVILSPKDQTDPSGSSGTPAASTEGKSSAEPVSVDPVTPDTEDSTEGTDGSESDTEGTDETSQGTESEAPETTSQTPPETSAPPATSSGTPSTVANADYGKVAFVGDSRLLYLGSGEDEKFAGLVPNDSINATSGAQVAFGVAHQDAMDAAVKNKQIAVFWYGINDVQVSYQREDAEFFIGEFSNVIDTYKSANTSNSRICILSVLSTGEAEKDYYPEQNANIEKYNAEIKKLCEEKGYTYLDVTGLFKGDACLRDDHIHFTKEWYENDFLPYIIRELGL